MPDLTILHTNDLHGKLSDRALERIAREKASSENVLLLDAGDAVSSGNLYYRRGGEPILARMSDLGYDAMAMGNREFHFLAAGLRSKVKLARFPVLSANLRSSDSPTGVSKVADASFNVNGLRVIVFGLTVPMITRRMMASRLTPFWFDDPITTAAEIVPGLRERADVLIALTHIGIESDAELAGSVAGIDLIVAGHTHAVFPDPKFRGETAIVHAGYWGRYLGRVEISLPGTPGGGPDIRTALIDLRTE
ncbi:MAG TPA: metallophosphatase [Armatimonadota bacterium]|nr:metallophosphatase [Armatimonadota bacterium]